MDVLIDDFVQAYENQDGHWLAQTLLPVSPSHDTHRIRRIWKSTTAHNAKGDVKHLIKARMPPRRGLEIDEANGWAEVYVAYWKSLNEILASEDGTPSWTKTYETWKDLTSALVRGYNNHGFAAWTIPTLYIVGKYLRLFAIRSDEERSRTNPDPSTEVNLMQDDFDPESDKQAQLRDCEQNLKRIFTLCLNDRAPLPESRKWGIYFIINLLFKTYFKLNSASLSRTILKTLAVYNEKGDMPPLDRFPKSQRVTFKYYEGVLLFLEENYVQAEKHLVLAWQLCHKDSNANMDRILTYLIPCRLLTSHVLPTKELLEHYPRLQRLFLPLSQCIRQGNLQGFDLAMQEREEEFVERRIYLTLERCRGITLRNLLRKVFIAGGFDQPKESDTAPMRRTRVPVAEFRAAICMGNGGEQIDTDEVECLLANMIYKDLMKGYIARERGIVVLSKKGAFPGTGV